MNIYIVLGKYLDYEEEPYIVRCYGNKEDAWSFVNRLLKIVDETPIMKMYSEDLLQYDFRAQDRFHQNDAHLVYWCKEMELL